MLWGQGNIDILGPLYHYVANEQIKFWVLVASSWWAGEGHYIPLIDQSTKSVIRALIQLSYRIGQHFELITSDHGSQFKPLSNEYTEQHLTDEQFDLNAFLQSLNPNQNATLKTSAHSRFQQKIIM